MPKRIDIDAVYFATLELFCRRGYGATTTKEIAARAQVNEVTLFRRFGSKAALIEAAIRHGLTNSPFGQLEASDDAHADMLEIVRSYLSAYEHFGELVLTLIAQLSHYPELRGAAEALMPNMQNVSRIIASHQEAGRIKPGNAFQMSLNLIAPLAVAGFMSQSGLGPEHQGLDVDAHVRNFLTGHAL